MFLVSKSDVFPLKILKTLLALCLAVPLFAFSSVIFPYTVPKVFAFRVLVEIAAVFYLYLVLKYPINSLPTLEKGGGGGFCHSGYSSVIPALRPSVAAGEGGKTGIQANQKNSGSRIKCGMTISVAVLIFFFVSFLSALFGTDFYSSFWGNLERGGGIFGLLHFAAFFFMLVSVFRIDGSKSNAPPFLKGGWEGFKSLGFNHQLIIVSVFTSTLISILAIGQHFFSLSNLLPQADRVYSLIGNAGVLGSYLIFSIFLTGYLVLSEFVIPTPQWRGKNLARMGESRIRERSFGLRLQDDNNNYFWIILYSLFSILNLFALLLSGTRGAWLGLLAGIIVFLLLSFFIPPFF